MPNDWGWADVVISEAVLQDGATREIRLPTMVPSHARRETSDQKTIRADVLRAVEQGRLIPGAAELFCSAGHRAWSGSSADVEVARVRGCPECAARPDELRLEETFFVPEKVARDVVAERLRRRS